MFVVGPSMREPVWNEGRILVHGSTNWTVASETNQQLSTVLAIGPSGAAGVDHSIRDMRQGATLVTFRDVQQCAQGSACYLEAHEMRFMSGVSGVITTTRAVGRLG